MSTTTATPLLHGDFDGVAQRWIDPVTGFIVLPKNMQRTWCCWAIPLMGADEYIAWRAEWIRRAGDTPGAWGAVWFSEGLLPRRVRDELARRGERT